MFDIVDPVIDAWAKRHARTLVAFSMAAAVLTVPATYVYYHHDTISHTMKKLDDALSGGAVKQPIQLKNQ